MNLTVIINTFNRPKVLGKCLDSLLLQSDKDFDIVVVDQSTNDESALICSNYKLNYIKNSKRNLSHSRNIGIKNAKSQLVAFIDDDARADPDWVKIIKSNFKRDSKLDILAGKVVDSTLGYAPKIQFRNGIVSLYGYIEDIHPLNETKYRNGNGLWLLRPMGTNMAFKKQTVINNGGFDEFYEYIHDETDITVRILKSGGKITYDNSLLVNHYPAKSINRISKYDINWFVDVKNNIYFGLKNANDFIPIRLLRSIKRIFFDKGAFSIIFKLFKNQNISFKDLIRFYVKAFRGLFVGIFCGLFGKRKLFFKIIK